jgi:hypothetical protein
MTGTKVGTKLAAVTHSIVKRMTATTLNTYCITFCFRNARIEIMLFVKLKLNFIYFGERACLSFCILQEEI